ncbi:SERTA domain-containing protein 3 [Epinephelus moara]|uniref:SERTA domain-containing protein 3 n=1 Tax=Epinephelus moara TaxID=300413 RepID=UPI00214E2174|nr:SERTA domain-containing protein 3 [Epinephelus moara]XP_049930812.1 SERTA domain-containing protein 3 [Epinephelus moara]
MVKKGQKRKHLPEDVEVSDRSSSTWESQRQFVLTVSLHKYQHGLQLRDPSLRRSVLICSTLRSVSLEGCRVPSVAMEVSQPPCSSSSELQESVFTAAKHNSTAMCANSHSALDSCPLVSLNNLSNCAASRSPANVTLSVKDEDEDWGSMSMDSNFSLSSAISSILTALDSAIDGSPQAAPRTPLRSLENLSGACEGGEAWAKQGVKGCGGSWEVQEEWRALDSSLEVMGLSYLGDLTVEDQFQDINTSLLERDMGMLGLRECEGGYPTVDDLLRYLMSKTGNAP